MIDLFEGVAKRNPLPGLIGLEKLDHDFSGLKSERLIKSFLLNPMFDTNL